MLGKYLKKNRKYSLAVISKKTGFSVVYLSEIEREVKKPRKKKTLKILSEGYGIDYSDLVDHVVQEMKDELGD